MQLRRALNGGGRWGGHPQDALLRSGHAPTASSARSRNALLIQYLLMSLLLSSPKVAYPRKGCRPLEPSQWGLGRWRLGRTALVEAASAYLFHYPLGEHRP